MVRQPDITHTYILKLNNIYHVKVLPGGVLKGVSLIATKPDMVMQAGRRQCGSKVIFQLSVNIKGPETAKGRGTTANKMDSTTIKTDGSIYTNGRMMGDVSNNRFVLLKQY